MSPSNEPKAAVGLHAMIGLVVYTLYGTMLKRILPNDFEQTISSSPLALVLFCQSTQSRCIRLELNLASAATELAASRSAAVIHMIDTAEWGGEVLRLRYGAATSSLAPELILFKRDLANVYHGRRDVDAVLSYLFAPQRGRALQPKTMRRPAADPLDTAGFFDDQPTDRVLELTSSNFREAVDAFPLLFVLFHSADTGHTNLLLANFSAAAHALHEQRVAARLARFEVHSGWPGSTSIAMRLAVTELPDIKIFRYARSAPYQACAGTLDIVDIARWNAGNLHAASGSLGVLSFARPRSSVHEVEAISGFEGLLAKHRIVLLAFTTSWCSRCLALATEFDAASNLLANAEEPVVLASVNLDNPRNRALIERFGVLSFPVGKIFHRGRLVGDFMGGSLAHEIVAEMLTVRDDLQRAEAATDADMATDADVVSDADVATDADAEERRSTGVAARPGL